MRTNHKKQTECKVCKNTFSFFPSQKREYCSLKCYWKTGGSFKGKKHSNETKEKFKNRLYLATPASFKKGHIPWCTGTKGIVIPWNKGVFKKRKTNICIICKKTYSHYHKTSKFCSSTCCGIASLGRLRHQWSNESRRKARLAKLGIKLTEEHKAAIGLAHTGEKNWRWIADRSKLARRQERNDMAYKEWRRQVWLRDNFKCKIGNPDCCGRIEAHHILGWSEYPELRYQINNGITLCHAHHPKKRAEEKRLIPFFSELVSVSIK